MLGLKLGDESIANATIRLRVKGAVGPTCQVQRSIQTHRHCADRLASRASNQARPVHAAFRAEVAQEAIGATGIDLAAQCALGAATEVYGPVDTGGQRVGDIRTCGAKKPCPDLAAVGAVLADEGVVSATVDLAVQGTPGQASHINRSIKTDTNRVGFVGRSRAQQARPGLAAVGQVLHHKGVTPAAIGLAVQRRVTRAAQVDGAVEPDGQCANLLAAGASEQPGPDLDALRTVLAQKRVGAANVGLCIQRAVGGSRDIHRAVQSGRQCAGEIFARRAQQTGPRLAAVNRVLGEKSVPISTTGLPVQRAFGIACDIDRTIEPDGQGVGDVACARAEQARPSLDAISAILCQEGVAAPAVGLAVERAVAVARQIDGAVEANAQIERGVSARCSE